MMENEMEETKWKMKQKLGLCSDLEGFRGSKNYGSFLGVPYNMVPGILEAIYPKPQAQH